MTLDECIDQAYETLFSRGQRVSIDLLVDAALDINGAQHELERVALEKAVRNETRELRRRAKHRLAVGEDDEKHEAIIPGQQRLFEELPGLKAPAMVALHGAKRGEYDYKPYWATTDDDLAEYDEILRGNIDRAVAKHRDRDEKREFLLPHRDSVHSTTLDALEVASQSASVPQGDREPEPVT